jgi:hypothetical protein
MRIFSAETMYYAQLTATSGVNFRNIILGIIGTLLVVVMAARGVGAYADQQYGKLVSIIAAAVPVAGFCYFPDQTIAIVKGLFTAFFGG